MKCRRFVPSRSARAVRCDRRHDTPDSGFKPNRTLACCALNEETRALSENAIDDEHVIDMVQVRNEVAAEVRAGVPG